MFEINVLYAKFDISLFAEVYIAFLLLFFISQVVSEFLFGLFIILSIILLLIISEQIAIYIRRNKCKS